MLRRSTKGAVYINIGRKPYGNGMPCKISSEGATSEIAHDLCRTFGALFRDDLDTLGVNPMLVFTAPLVLNHFSLRNISY